MSKAKVTYSQVGDNYETKDPVLRMTLDAANSTLANLKGAVSESLGESAFVWEQNDCYMAQVLECLGTKNLVADQMRKITGKTYYDVIAYDTVATFINDLSTVGAKPLSVLAYWAIEDNKWLQDKQRIKDFVSGWRSACMETGCAWGGGETPTLKGIINPNTVDLAGSVVGIIKPKKRLITYKKLKAGDRIILIKSNGPNANGISLVRAITKKMKNGYATVLLNGKMFGDEIMKKSNIYTRLVQDLLDEIDIHYIVNITGHGLRKIMRARQNFSYILEKIFDPLPVFDFIKSQANLSDYEMYQTYNMGMDYAIFVREKDADRTLKIIKKKGFTGLNGGVVQEGHRKVVIKPKNITFESQTYQIR